VGEILVAILIVLALLGMLLSAFVLGIVSFARLGRVKRLSERIDRLEAALRELAERPRAEAPGPEPVEKAPAGEQPAEPEPVEAELVEGPAEFGPEVPLPTPTPILPSPQAPREPIQWELLVGRKALGWIAVVSLVFAAAFFLRYAIENEWIGPLGRVAVGAVTGVALLVGGWHYDRRGWRIFSQMLSAAGVIVLYLSTYSAFGFYHLLPREAATIFLAVVIVESAILAVRYDSLAIALTAVLGGLATPVLMHSGHDLYAALFTYLALLNVGVLLLLLLRAWAAIGTVALLGTQALFWSWYTGNYHPEKLDWTIGFQAVLFGLFLADSLGTYAFRWRRTLWEDSGRLILNAAFWFTAVYVLFREDYGPWMGTAAVGMAVVYALLGRLMLACRPNEPAALLTSLAVAVGFVALAFPIQAEAHWVALGWMAEAAVLWWFGVRVRSAALRGLAGLLAGCSVLRLLAFDLPTGVREPFVPVFNEFALPAIGVAACLLVAVAAGRRLVKRLEEEEQILVALAGLGGVVLLWLVLTIDCYGFFRSQAEVYGDPARWRWLGQMSLSILWAVYATVVLALGFRFRLAGLRWTALGLYVITVVKVFLVDMAGLDQIYRIAAFFVLAIFLGIAAWAYQRIRIELSSAAEA
jgi:uncharacterized membrane protein